MTNPAGMAGEAERIALGFRAGEAERIALGFSMSVFAVVAVLGNVLFWFALLCDKRVGFYNKYVVHMTVIYGSGSS